MPVTIRRMAAFIRHNNINEIGEWEFVKLLASFDKVAKGDIGRVLLIMLSRDPSDKLYQLGLCWLAGRGYGEGSYQALNRLLKAARQDTPID